MHAFGRILVAVGITVGLLMLLEATLTTATVEAQTPVPADAANPATMVPGFTFYSPTYGLVTREYTFPDIYFTGYSTVTLPKSQTYLDVVLNTPPGADVTLPFSSTDTTEGVIEPASLTFTPANWNIPQRVTISSVDDLYSINPFQGVIQDVLTYTLVLSPAISSDPAYDALDPQDFVITNQDNELPLNRHAGGTFNTSYFAEDDIVYDNRLNRTIMRYRLTQIGGPGQIANTLVFCDPLFLSGTTQFLYLENGTTITGSYGTSPLSIFGPYVAPISYFTGTGKIEITYPGIFPLQSSQLRLRYNSGTIVAPSTQTLGCTVNPPAQNMTLIDSPPVGTNDTYTAYNTRVLRVAAPQGVLANDTPSGENVRLRPLRSQLVAPPPQGQLALMPDGSFTYTPTVDYLGTVTFTYLAEQNELMALLTSTVTINIGIGPLQVINTQNDGPGSLRGSVYTAGLISGPDTIDFDPALAGQAISLTSGEIAINQNLSIDASPLTTPLTIDGNGASRIFNIGGGNTVSLAGLTIRNGNAAGNGGGILNNGSNLTLTNINFLGNQATGNGGGLYSTNTNGAFVNLAFGGNHATGNGGGAYHSNGSPILTNVTFSGNRAGGNGGGLYNSTATPLIQNSIFWNNQDSSGAGTASASINNVSSTPTIRYSVVQGSGGSGGGWNPILGIDGGNNTASDPLFMVPVNPASAPTSGGDLRLQEPSSAVDGGDDAADIDGSAPGTTTISDIPTDALAEVRRRDGNGDDIIRVDQGAYEHPTVPLGVTLASFIAEVRANGIDILWETASEVDTLGFHLYRSTDPSQVGERLNSDLIPAQGPGGGQGALYTYLDETVTIGTTYFYWLEDVDLYGATTLHGPVSATMMEPSALATSPLTATGAEAFYPLLLATVLGLLVVLGILHRHRA